MQCRKSASRLLDGDDRVERTLIVRNGVHILGISAPSSVNDKLVLVFARSEFEDGGEGSAFRFISHLLASRIPIIEGTGEIDGAIFISVNREGDVLSSTLLGRALFSGALD